MRIFKAVLFAVFAFLSLAVLCLQPVQAQYVKPQASSVSVGHARSVAISCIGQWESQRCLQSLSESALVLISNYGAALQEAGKMQELELLKENCAASTAARQGEYPAYAMKSAFTVCSNTIYDIWEKTQIMLDQSHYQLLVAPIMCMNSPRKCKSIEAGLSRFR